MDSFNGVIIKKLDELIEEGNQLLASAHSQTVKVSVPEVDDAFGMVTGYHKESRTTGLMVLDVSRDTVRFATSSLSFLYQYTGGETSLFYSGFKTQWDKLSSTSSISTGELQILIGLLEAAKREVSQGFLLPMQFRMAAEVYSEILDSVQKRFENKEYREAAILEGAILEEGLKQIANFHKVPLTKKKPVEIAHGLVKTKVIIEYEKKKIEQWTEIHNKAEHEPEEFKKILKRNKKDVEQMPLEVKKFLGKYLNPS